MKLFKKIPIEGYEGLEINEDGYVLNIKTADLMKLRSHQMFPATTGEMYLVSYIINQTFKNK